MYLKSNRIYLRIISWVLVLCLIIDTSLYVVFIFEQIRVNRKILIDKVMIPSLRYEQDEKIIISDPEIDYDVNIKTESYSIPNHNVFEEPINHKKEPVNEIYKFSDNDISMIARVTMSEASTQAFEVQVAVAQTVINRLHSGIFGSDIRDIVYSEDQFSTADNGEPNEQVLLAVKEAIMSMPYPSNMYYFRQWYYHSWAVDYKKIGDLYFSLEPCDN